MNEWVSFNKSLSINVCVIVKRRSGKYDKWEYTEVSRFVGDWNDLVEELNTTYGIFSRDVEFLPRAARHDRLDGIADELAKKDMPYEFMLPDGTDEWYVAYCKPITFRVDSYGGLR
jgi:hypothetical protein